MALTNSNISYTGLVEKYVGTAYDKMAEIHTNLQELLMISTAIQDGSFDALVDIADDLSDVTESIDLFKSTYYGALPTDPVLDPLGNAVTTGDLYWNSTDQYMRVCTAIAPEIVWHPMGAIQKSVEAQTISAAMELSGVVSLEDTYVPGQNNLMVFINGVHRVSKTAQPAFGTFYETNGKTLTFDSDPLFVENAEIAIVVGVEVSTVKHVIDIEHGTYETVTPNEQEITLPNNQAGEPMVYVVGDSNLEVFLDRRLQLPGYDYVETSPVKVTFNVPLQQNQEIYFKKGSVISNETGVQQVLMQDTQPGIGDYAAGQLWYRTNTGRFYILYEDVDAKQWVGLTNEDTVITPGVDPAPVPPGGIVTTQGMVVQNAAPEPSTVPVGTFWLKSNTGELFVMYYDADSAQWLKVST